MRRLVAIAGGLAAVVLGVLLIVNLGGKEEAQVLGTEEIKQLVREYSSGKSDVKNASISSSELIVTGKNNQSTSYPLPKDEFFVSIAPFVNETHPCAIHSLTGCQGEMKEQDIKLTIKDAEGNTVIDETVSTLGNGFVDLWLPRDKTYSVKIEQNGLTSESQISTFEGDNTCITTMRLA
ncbi:CueP family metal-binding protein [Paenibacillus sp. CAU 1782]